MQSMFPQCVPLTFQCGRTNRPELVVLVKVEKKAPAVPSLKYLKQETGSAQLWKSTLVHSRNFAHFKKGRRGKTEKGIEDSCFRCRFSTIGHEGGGRRRTFGTALIATR